MSGQQRTTIIREQHQIMYESPVVLLQIQPPEGSSHPRINASNSGEVTEQHLNVLSSRVTKAPEQAINK